MLEHLIFHTEWEAPLVVKVITCVERADCTKYLLHDTKNIFSTLGASRGLHLLLISHFKQQCIILFDFSLVSRLQINFARAFSPHQNSVLVIGSCKKIKISHKRSGTAKAGYVPSVTSQLARSLRGVLQNETVVP